MYCKMITTISLFNIHHHAELVFVFSFNLVMRTFENQKVLRKWVAG